MSEVVLNERPYQRESADLAANDAIHGKNPIVGQPTGSGKSIILCGITERLIDNDPLCNILILSHVQEILDQNHKALRSYFGGIGIGLYSAGLNTKITSKITVAGIQSAWKQPDLFKHFDYVLIDEAHRIGFDKKTVYRKFINKIKPKSCIGLTATPYRTKGGYIYEGDDSLFDCISIDWTIGDRFNSLIEDGYLSPIYSKKTALKMDISGVRTTGGDFNSKDLSEKLDRDNITEGAILETVHFGKKYKHWLFFAINIEHAENIKKSLESKGISACVIHNKMKGNRKKVIKDYKAGKYRALINVEMLTTGFDFPGIDLIVMLRPTKSPIIHVQTAGRGLRPIYAEGYDLLTKEGRLAAIENGPKQHCLVLDFAGNTARLGPINDPVISKKDKRLKKGGVITKDCPKCSFINPGAVKFCINCNYEFNFKEKITLEASRLELIKKTEIEKKKVKKKEWVPAQWIKVDKVEYEISESKKVGEFLRIIYHCGMNQITEVVCLEGNGWAKHNANNWIRFRWQGTVKPPITTQMLFLSTGALRQPKKILVDLNGEYANIKDATF